jgi:hypothetical protein
MEHRLHHVRISHWIKTIPLTKQLIQRGKKKSYKLVSLQTTSYFDSDFPPPYLFHDG